MLTVPGTIQYLCEVADMSLSCGGAGLPTTVLHTVYMLPRNAARCFVHSYQHASDISDGNAGDNRSGRRHIARAARLQLRVRGCYIGAETWRSRLPPSPSSGA